MKKWMSPELHDLKIEATKNESTMDFPHYYECTKCGKHWAQYQCLGTKGELCGDANCGGMVKFTTDAPKIS